MWVVPSSLKTELASRYPVPGTGYRVPGTGYR